MADRTGGPAFPVSWQDGDGQMVATPGMTLRDYFAGQALAAYLSAHGDDGDRARQGVETVAEWAYENADAMIAAREAARG